MGFFGHLLRGSFFSNDTLLKMTYVTDFAIGATLVIIGAMGIREVLAESNENEHQGKEAEVQLESSSAVESDDLKTNKTDDSVVPITSSLMDECNDLPPNLQQRIGSKLVSWRNTTTAINMSLAIFFNGFFLGFSWDGLPSLTPALGINSIDVVLVFLLGYCVGTAAAMSFACAVIGECTFWLGKTTNALLPSKLAFASALLAVCVGLFWIGDTAVVMCSDYRHRPHDLLGDVGDRTSTAGPTTSSLLHHLFWFSPLAIVGIVLVTVLRDFGVASTSEVVAMLVSSCSRWEALSACVTCAVWPRALGASRKGPAHTV